MTSSSREISRREIMKAGALVAAGSAIGPTLLSVTAEAEGPTKDSVEQWGIFEASYAESASGNPFVEVEFGATFEQAGNSVAVEGFYDGGGVYRVRFMPNAVGDWTYRTHSNRPKLDGKTGTFTTHAARGANHGPMRVKDQYHFIYADGAPYRELGTTCYAWTSQPPALEEQTLKTLATAPFNKMRMCIFPKWYHYNQVEPPQYPFVARLQAAGISRSLIRPTFSISKNELGNWARWVLRSM